MKTNIFDTTDHFLMLNFFATCRQTSNLNGIHGVAAAWCMIFVMTKLTAASWASQLYLKDKNISDKPKRMLPSWKEVVRDLLETMLPMP